MATIHVKDNPNIIYNVLPIVKKSIKKRSLNTSYYDSNMNSHAIIKENIRDLKFDTIDSNLKCFILTNFLIIIFINYF